MSNQSSVEWLIKQAENLMPPDVPNAWVKIKEQAKSMHQKEHEDAFFEGAKCFREGQAWTDQGFREFSRILYSETFGKSEQ